MSFVGCICDAEKEREKREGERARESERARECAIFGDECVLNPTRES